MIDLKEKRRRSKRKLEENVCRVQPKETILDMSVSKLAKAKTRVNLEPSLRKTVMIVNTIRKIEQEIENGKGVIANEMMYVERHCTPTKGTSDMMEETMVKTTEVVPVRLNLSLEKRTEPSFVCENNSELLDNRCRSFGVNTLAKSRPSDECFVDLTRTTDMNFKNKFMVKCSSPCIATAPTHRDLPCLEDEEINFAEVDISLYDFDATLAWSEGGFQYNTYGDLEDNDSTIYKTNTGLSALIRRCSDDLKLSKTTDNSFTDDLDQIMQVLVGI